MPLTATNISFAYPSELKPSIDGVSASIERGEFVVLIGANGCGKSTLARLLSGLYLPDQGHVVIDDLRTDDAGQRIALRRKVGMLFQHPENQIVSQTVADDIAFGLENLNQPPAEIEQKVYETLDKIGLSEYAAHSPDELSGGQLQRLALGGVLVLNPDYLLIDEPFAWLDLEAQRSLLPLLKSICKEGCGMVVVSQETDVLEHADRVWLMHQGQLKEISPNDLAHQPGQFETIGLQAPPVFKLCQQLKSNLELPDSLFDLDTFINHIRPQLKESDTAPEASPQTKHKEKLLSAEQIGFSYDPRASKPSWLFSEVDFALNRGDWMAVSGPSGCGKSTMVQLFNGLLKPLEGDIVFDGQSILRQNTAQLCRQVGLVFQNPRQQFFAPTVFEEMAYAIQEQPDVEQRVHHVCEQLHLNLTVLSRPPQTLSGGEQLKVALGSLLLLEAQLLILDETLTSLDSGARATILNLLQELNQSGLSLMVVTHRPAQLPWANLAWLESGRLALYSPKDIPSKWLPEITQLSERLLGKRLLGVDEVYQDIIRKLK